MGIIQQQTIKGTFFSYLGVLIGFISINMIQPHALTTEQVGLTGLLLTYSALFSKFATLGFSGTSRYFPYFRDEEKKHHGYLFLYSVISLIGIAIFIGVIFFFKSTIISSKAQKSPLFASYYWYLVPLIAFSVYFDVFDLYSRLLYNAISGRILQEFTKRLFILVAILLVFFKMVSFNTFMLLWLIANVLPTLLLAGRLFINKQFFMKPDLEFLDRDMVKKLTKISLLGILVGSSPLIVNNIDSYMINSKLGLSATGVYTIAAYFAIVITLPSRSLYNISTTVVAESFKHNDLANIKMVYEKSCINQLIASLFLLILIWANVDNIFTFLPPSYSAGKYVVLFIGLQYLIDSATGINGVILNTSKYYMYDGYFYLLLVGVTIGTNMLLIPIFGITGSAIAAAITTLTYNLFRYIFILVVFKMQPYTLKSPLTLLIGGLIYLASLWLVPRFQNIILDTVLRSLFLASTYGLAVYYLNLSDDVKKIMAEAITGMKLKFLRK